MEDLNELKDQIKTWSSELGFEGMGVSNINIEEDANHLKKWLEKKHHGSMTYMKKHGKKRKSIQRAIIYCIARSRSVPNLQRLSLIHI